MGCEECGDDDGVYEADDGRMLCLPCLEAGKGDGRPAPVSPARLRLVG